MVPFLLYFFGIDAVLEVQERDTGQDDDGLEDRGCDNVGNSADWKAGAALSGLIRSGAAFVPGLCWVAFDKSRRGFHDMIARTAVLQEEKP